PASTWTATSRRKPSAASSRAGTARARIRGFPATSSISGFRASSRPMADRHKPDTLGVRAGAIRSDFQEHSEALVLSTSFVYASAEEAARKFASTAPDDNIYSRFTNPTVRMFQDRLAALEGAQACVGTATGMAAITTMVFGLLKSGDHMIVARGVFGTVVPLLDQIASKFGIQTTWVDATSLDAWRAAV